MSAFLLVHDEDKQIVKTRPGMMFAAQGNQADDPGEDLQTVGSARIPKLPDPSVGGENGSRIRNGYTVGIRSLFNRTQPFMGQMAKAPAITNPVQGDVGQSNRADRLYQGVLNQFVQYTPTLSQSAQSFVGKLPAMPSQGK